MGIEQGVLSLTGVARCCASVEKGQKLNSVA